MGLSPQQAEDVFDDVVELSALGDAIDLPMRTYSSGMGSRLKFAISLAANPSILMIDEALADRGCDVRRAFQARHGHHARRNQAPYSW